MSLYYETPTIPTFETTKYFFFTIYRDINLEVNRRISVLIKNKEIQEFLTYIDRNIAHNAQNVYNAKKSLYLTDFTGDFSPEEIEYIMKKCSSKYNLLTFEFHYYSKNRMTVTIHKK